MAEVTEIAWTKSTFNPWIGCTKVGPGCDSCYAEALDKRHKWGGATHWGPGVPRHRTSAAYWHKPEIWNKVAPMSEFAGRKGFWPVFCASLADVFDNEVPQAWRADLFELIENTPNLSWLLVTKRIGNVRSMVPTNWLESSVHPERIGFPPNVRLMITIVNKEEAYRDINKLLALRCKNGISFEPALEAVDFSCWLRPVNCVSPDPHGRDRSIDWIICGGESSQGAHKARPFDVQWARDTITQCKAADVPVFMKQCGSAPCEYVRNSYGGGYYEPLNLKDRAGADPSEWPQDINVREFP